MVLPYRGDELALRQRLEALDANLRELGASAGPGRPAPAGDRARLEGERAELIERLAAFGERFSPEGLRPASPCGADWGAMAGDERVRFCSKCQKHVYQLSGLRHAEAEALVHNAEGGHFVRLRRRADGTVLSGDCPEGSAEKFQRRLPLIAGSGALVAASAVASVSFALGGAVPRESPEPASSIDQSERLDPRVFAKYYGPINFPEGGVPSFPLRPPRGVRVGPSPSRRVAEPGPPASRRSR